MLVQVVAKVTALVGKESVYTSVPFTLYCTEAL